MNEHWSGTNTSEFHILNETLNIIGKVDEYTLIRDQYIWTPNPERDT